MPFPFVVPPKDLMFVFGDFQTNPERGWIMEGMPGVTTTKVPPNGYIGGRIDLDVPYSVGKDDLPTPFANKIDPPTGTTLHEVKLRELGAIQLAVQYWFHDPSQDYVPGAAPGDHEDRRMLAWAAIDGSKVFGDNMVGYSHVALSPRVEVRIPLKGEYSIFVPEEN